MTSVLVYEHLTATSAGGGPGPLPASLVREGRAMLDAVTADLATLPDTTFQIASSADALVQQAAAADFTLIIAPECGGLLLDLATRVVAAGGTLLGPSPAAIRLTADKRHLFDWWTRQSVPTPATREYDGQPVQRPTVVKPRDGAGSQATKLLQPGHVFSEAWPGPLIAQHYVEGLAASVSFLCGPAGVTPLRPCEQLLSEDGRFAYLGGRAISDAPLADRAVVIATKAVSGIPGLLGYVGVDVILGIDGHDWAIEINPRLTTSYVGLRAMTDQNLMGAMLAARFV